MWSRLKSWYVKNRIWEPARLKAVWAAVIALGASLGIGIPAGVNGWVQTGISILAVVVPILQGESTRNTVYAPGTVLTHDH